VNTITSVNSARAKAVKLANEMRIVVENIVRYATFVFENRIDGGNCTAIAENTIRRIMEYNPDLTILLALSAPRTSVTISFIVKTSGKISTATLAVR